MRAKDLVSETRLSLTANKGRSFLTILGIVVGIASVIVMVAIGQGTQESITASIQAIGSNLLIISPGGESSFGPAQGEHSLSAAAMESLTMDDVDAIKQRAQGIKAVAPQVSGSLPVTAGKNGSNVSITGTTVGYPAVRGVDVATGSWFTEAQEIGASKVAVLGPDTSDALFGSGSNPVGQRIRIDGEPFSVVGVTVAEGGGLGSSDNVVYLPVRTMQTYLSGGDSVNTIYVEAESQEGMAAAQQSIESILLAEHGIASMDDADFSVTSQADLASTMETVTNLLTMLLGSIAGISLLVGGIGIMNMMLTTVTERIREIGLRKAIGANRGDITSQFLSEAVALTVTGGIVGILLGWGISALITATGVLNASVSLDAIALATGVSTAIGLVFGYYPARRAAKLDPIEALRYQ